MGFVSDDKKIVLQMVNQVGVQFDAIDALYKQTTENSKSNITYKQRTRTCLSAPGSVVLLSTTAVTSNEGMRFVVMT